MLRLSELLRGVWCPNDFATDIVLRITLVDALRPSGIAKRRRWIGDEEEVYIMLSVPCYSVKAEVCHGQGELHLDKSKNGCCADLDGKA
jgi:hypothetical protein